MSMPFDMLMLAKQIRVFMSKRFAAEKNTASLVTVGTLVV